MATAGCFSRSPRGCPAGSGEHVTERRDRPAAVATTTYSSLPNELLSAANGVDYAYRDTSGGSDGAIALILLQHFRGNLDNWDPALVDALARTRRVIAFDNAGVGGSTGMTRTPSSRWRATR